MITQDVGPQQLGEGGESPGAEGTSGSDGGRAQRNREATGRGGQGPGVMEMGRVVPDPARMVRVLGTVVGVCQSELGAGVHNVMRALVDN